MPPVLSAPPTAPATPTGTGITPLRYGVGFTPSWVKSDPKFQQFLNQQNQQSAQFYSGVGNWVQQGLSVVGDKAKEGVDAIGFGATVLGLALQESYEVTSAYVSGLTNRPRLAPSSNLLRRTSPENDTNPDPVIKGTNYFPINVNSQVKINSIEFKYNRRIEKSPDKIPKPQDPDTPTQDKPVVTITQTIQKKGYGSTLHTPILASSLTIQQLDTSEAVAKIAQFSEQSSTSFSNWLSKSAGDNLITGQIEFRDTAFTYLPQSLGLDSFLIGTNALDALAQTFKEAANQATVNPPTIGIYSEIKIEQKPVQIPDPVPIELPVDHWNVGSVEQVKNSIIFPEPVVTNIEDLLTFMGKQTVTDQDFPGVDGYETIPNRSEFSELGKILGGDTLDPENPQKIVANTVFDLNFLATAATYYRSGLHELPGVAVALHTVGEKVENPPQTRLNNATSLNVYQNQVTDKKLGDFPIEISIKDEDGNPINLRDVPGVDQETKKKEKTTPDGNFLASSVASIAGILASLGLSNGKATNMNFGMLTGLAASTAGAAAAAVKAAGCACAGLDAMGSRTNPDCTPATLPFNFGVAGKNPTKNPNAPTGSPKDFMQPSQGCFPSTINADNETMLDLLRDIRYGVAIAKQALLKTPKDIQREQEALEKMAKGINKTNKERWEKFKDAVRKEDSYLNKHYPVKPKIVERGADGLPKS